MFGWIRRLDQHFPIRYSAWALCAVGLVLAFIGWMHMGKGLWLVLGFLALVLLGLRDTHQTRHSVLRNYPVMGHLRFLFEFVRA